MSSGTSNAPDIATGHNPPGHRPSPSKPLTKRYWGYGDPISEEDRRDLGRAVQEEIDICLLLR
jgi:hypothetical protein